MKDNIFITGATGMLAGYLHTKAKKKFNSILLHHRKIKINHNYIKINYYKKNEIIKLFLKFRPRLLIHTAGITNVEKCEKNEKITLKVNYEITKKWHRPMLSSLQLSRLRRSAILNGTFGKYNEQTGEGWDLEWEKKCKPMLYASREPKGIRFLFSFYFYLY